MKNEIEIRVRLDDKKATQKKLMDLGWTSEGIKFQREYTDCKPDKSCHKKEKNRRAREDGDSPKRILEKYRQTLSHPKNDVEIGIDSLPFGDYLEIEGSSRDIELIVPELGLSEESRITNAYWIVYSKYCAKQKVEEDHNVVFGELVITRPSK